MFDHCQHCGKCYLDKAPATLTAHLREKHDIRNRRDSGYGIPQDEFIAENFIRHDAGEYVEHSRHAAGPEQAGTLASCR